MSKQIQPPPPNSWAELDMAGTKNGQMFALEVEVTILVEVSIHVTIFNWKNMNLYKIFYLFVWMIAR